MKSICLEDFIKFLDEQTEDGFRSNAVEDYLSEHHLDQDEFASYIFFREETYGRNLVVRRHLYELLVLTWLPGQFSPVLEHEGQRCWVTVHSGKLTFQKFSLSPKKKLLLEGAPQTHVAGESFLVDEHSGIYSVSNQTSKPAVSVHLYSSPVEECRVYDETSQTFQWVEMTYFTDPKDLQLT